MTKKEIELPINQTPAGDKALNAQVLQTRKVNAHSQVRGFVKYTVRKWVYDENGPLVGVDGKRGYYQKPKVIDQKKFNVDFESLTPEQKAWIDNLLTNDGRDKIHVDMYTTTSKSGSGFNYIGLSENVSAPNASDTSLTGEITTNGLARIQATTRSHTTGTNTSTIQHTFTASGAFTAVQKAALFNDAGPPVNGTMGHENTFTSVALQTNDQLQVSWTITAG